MTKDPITVDTPRRSRPNQNTRSRLLIKGPITVDTPQASQTDQHKRRVP